MRAPALHPRLVATACMVYGLTLCIYPREFRDAFRAELALTFRNRVEDVLDNGSVLDCLAFAAHIAFDAVCARCTLVSQADSRHSVSVLGLTQDEAAPGHTVWAAVDTQFTFRMVGFLLAGAGCYAFFATLLASVS